MSWVHDCSMLVEMLFLYAVISSNAVEKMYTTANSLKFVADTWYFLLNHPFCWFCLEGWSWLPCRDWRWLHSLPLYRSTACRCFSEQPWWPLVTRNAVGGRQHGGWTGNTGLFYPTSHMFSKSLTETVRSRCVPPDPDNSQLKIGLPWAFLAPCI